MAAIGRGIGRGIGENRDKLRRPGQPILESNKFSNVVHAINNLSISTITTESTIEAIIKEIEESQKKSTAEELFEELHKLALSNRQFAIKLAIAFSDPKVCHMNDNQFRNLLLQKMQQDYEDREEIKKRNIEQFRNVVSLMGEIFHKLRISGLPLFVIQEPLIVYLEMLLSDSEEDDIELVATQIYLNGGLIYQNQPGILEDFNMSVRKVLINRNLSSKSRGLLLLITDLANQQYMPFSEKYQNFYTNQLGQGTLRIIQHYSEEVKEGSTNGKDELYYHGDTKGNHISNNVGLTSSKNDYHNPRVEDQSLERNDRPVIPRAIRGAGANENAKDKNLKKSPKAKETGGATEQIWLNKPTKFNKGWDHDDRFDKDYS